MTAPATYDYHPTRIRSKRVVLALGVSIGDLAVRVVT